MALPAPRRRGRRAAAVALTAGAVAMLATLVVIVYSVNAQGAEERVAAEFLSQLFAGEGQAAYDLATDEYQAVVRADELDAIADQLVVLLGEGSVETVGAQRQGLTVPAESWVGYTGTGSVGAIEGVITLVQTGEGTWSVRDISYRFPDASAAQTEAIDALTRVLNEQVAARMAQRSN